MTADDQFDAMLATMPDPVSGGFVRTPAGVDERHVLLTSGQWRLRSALQAGDVVREFGGCCMLGSGQLVPLLPPDDVVVHYYAGFGSCGAVLDAARAGERMPPTTDDEAAVTCPDCRAMVESENEDEARRATDNATEHPADCQCNDCYCRKTIMAARKTGKSDAVFAAAMRSPGNGPVTLSPDGTELGRWVQGLPDIGIERPWTCGVHGPYGGEQGQCPECRAAVSGTEPKYHYQVPDNGGGSISTQPAVSAPAERLPGANDLYCGHRDEHGLSWTRRSCPICPPFCTCFFLPLDPATGRCTNCGKPLFVDGRRDQFCGHVTHAGISIRRDTCPICSTPQAQRPKFAHQAARWLSLRPPAAPPVTLAERIAVAAFAAWLDAQP